MQKRIHGGIMKEQEQWFIVQHNLRQKDGISRWAGKIHGKGRRRIIELQKWKGRLYLVGMIWEGHSLVLPFESTLCEVLKVFGTLEST